MSDIQKDITEIKHTLREIHQDIKELAAQQNINTADIGWLKKIVYGASSLFVMAFWYVTNKLP